MKNIFKAFWNVLRGNTRDSIGSLPAPSFPSLECALGTLYELGFRPSFAVDVGAYRGDWTRMFRKIFPQCTVLMIEAQDAKLHDLAKLVEQEPERIRCEGALLGSAEDFQVEFFEMETGSSVFEETSPYSRTKVTKYTKTLDGILAAGQYPSVDFIKLDVQGYELEVLKGASQAMKQSQGVLLEASVVPINSGCPLIAEVIAFMAKNGFVLFDFCSQIRRKDGVLWQTDLLFLKASSSIRPKAALDTSNW